MKSFKDVLAWKKAYNLTLEIYRLTCDFPRAEEFGLKSQLRRASVSVISNIAEGFKRKHTKDKLKFYNQAEASLEEVKCQTMLSNDLGYLDAKKYSELKSLEDEVGRLLNGWAESTRSYLKSPLNR